MGFRTLKNVLDKKFKTLELDGLYKELLGSPEPNGLWLIYGAEKMFKTTFCLILAKYLSSKLKTGYIMAEQGIDKDFQDVIKRLSIKPSASLKISGYISIEELNYLIKKKNQPDILILDNFTVYNDELRAGVLRKLILDNPKKLFIGVAHEEKGLPYTASAKLAKKLAKRIIHVEGAMATVEGRTAGGSFIIDEEKAQLYHGTIDN